jgi:hypothetical protein
MGAITTFEGNALSGLEGSSIGGKSDGAVEEEPKKTLFEKTISIGNLVIAGASTAQSAADKILKDNKKDNGAQRLSKLTKKYLPVKKQMGTQQAKKLIEKTGVILGKVGKVLTRVGSVFQALDFGYKVYKGTVKKSDLAAIVTTVLSIACPVFGAIWGATSFIMQITTGKSLEETIFD